MNVADAVRRLRSSAYWRDIAWLATGNALAQAVGVAAMPALTRLYSPDDFAMQSLFLQVLGFAIVLLTMRYEHLVQLPKEDGTAISLLLLVFLMGIIGAVIATPLVWYFQDSLAKFIGMPTLTVWLVLVPATAFLMCFSIALQNYAQRKGLYRLSSLSELGNKGSYIVTALAGFWILPAPAGLMLGTTAGTVGKILCLSGTNVLSMRSDPRFLSSLTALRSIKTFRSLCHVAREYVRLSGSMVVSHLLMSCTAIIPSIYIARAYGTDSLGQFALAASTIYLPSGLIGSAIGQVYYQRAAESWVANRSFDDLWRSTAKRLIFVGIPIYLTLLLVSPWIYPFIFGSQWAVAGQLAALMAVSAFFSFITTPLDRACLVVGAWKYIPLWHSARVLSTAFVVWLSWVNNWELKSFVIGLVLQMSILFLVDYWSEYRFSLRRRVEILT